MSAMLNVNRQISVFTALLAIMILSACASSKGNPKKAVQPSATTLNATTAEPTVAAHGVTAQSAAERTAVVHVGGTSITKGLLNHWISVMTPKVASYEPQNRVTCGITRVKTEVSSPKMVKGHPPTVAQLKQQCEQEHALALKKQVLGILISEVWVIQEAARDGLRITADDVNRQLEEERHKQFSSEAEFQKYLKEARETVADLRLRIRSSLAGEAIRGMIKSRIGGVTQASIADYYNTHKRLYFIPEHRDIEAIRTWTKPSVEKAEKEIRSGVSFANVAKRVSIDRPSNEHGGVTLGVVPGQEETGYNEAIFAAKPHVLVGPLYLRKRYYIFEVTKIAPGKQKPFKEIESSIAQELPAALEQQAVVRFIKAWRARWRSKTDCRPGYVVQKCKQFKTSRAAPEDLYTLN